jgi:hypothetical protein
MVHEYRVHAGTSVNRSGDTGVAFPGLGRHVSDRRFGDVNIPTLQSRTKARQNTNRRQFIVA